MRAFHFCASGLVSYACSTACNCSATQQLISVIYDPCWLLHLLGTRLVEFALRQMRLEEASEVTHALPARSFACLFMHSFPTDVLQYLPVQESAPPAIPLPFLPLLEFFRHILHNRITHAHRMSQVVLETEVTNHAAIALYEKLGFARDKRLYRYYLSGVDALRLKLWLQ